MVVPKLSLRPILKAAALDSCSLLLEAEGHNAQCLDFRLEPEGRSVRIVFELRESGRIGEALCLADDRDQARSGPLKCVGAADTRVVAQPVPGKTWRTLANAGDLDFRLSRSSVFDGSRVAEESAGDSAVGGRPLSDEDSDFGANG